MEINAGQLLADPGGLGASFAQLRPRAQEKDRLATGRIKDLRVRVLANRPTCQEFSNRRRREECTPRLSSMHSVVGWHDTWTIPPRPVGTRTYVRARCRCLIPRQRAPTPIYRQAKEQSTAPAGTTFAILDRARTSVHDPVDRPSIPRSHASRRRRLAART